MKTTSPIYRSILIFALLQVYITTTTLGFLVSPVSAQEKMYQEFNGIMLFYKPATIDSYRQLLPKVFDMPDEPLVQAYVIDFYKMAPWTIKPYLEAAFFLLAKYKGEAIWHCVTMPVTTDEARIGGIKYFGYPKVLSDITLERKPSAYSGRLMAEGQTIMEMQLDTSTHKIMPQEKEWFERLTGIGSLNILNGRVIDPMPGAKRQKDSLYKIAQMYPATLTVKVGQAELILHPEAAPTDKNWRPSAFTIRPAEIVLAYYFQNKFGFSFVRPKYMSD